MLPRRIPRSIGRESFRKRLLHFFTLSVAVGALAWTDCRANVLTFLVSFHIINPIANY